MPFYNCYCGENIEDIDFDSTGSVEETKLQDTSKILTVPVKFGKTYTIAIDSELPIEICMAVYGDKGLLKDYTDNLNDISINTSDNAFLKKHNTYRKY